MPQRRWPSRGKALIAVRESTVLALGSVLTYWLVSGPISHIYSESSTDDMLGGLWAVLSTIFVLRESYQQSITAAVSRMSATTVSFVLCLIYLIFLPFHVWALGLLIGVSALAVTVIGRPGDAITAAISTAVVMIVAGVSPHQAWHQPILRFADTLVGVVVGIAAAWADLHVVRRWLPISLAERQGG
jgi:uncharacterized membrane protein YccC